MKTPPALAGLAVTLLAASSVSAQQGTPLQTGRVYEGGVRLHSPLAGASITVPDGFQAAWDEDVQALLIGRDAGDLMAGVWGWSEATPEEVELGVAELLSGAGIRLAQREEPERDEDGMRGFFVADTDEGRGLLYAVVRAGPHGNAMAAAAMGPAESESAVAGLVDGVVASLEWSEPAASGWRAQVEGTVLSASASGSDYSTGGAAPGSGASQSSTTLALCRGARYQYESVSETYISIPGASASSESRDGHAGSWWLVADLAGNASLWLESDDGRVFQWSVVEDGDAYLVDGTRYVVSGGC